MPVRIKHRGLPSVLGLTALLLLLLLVIFIAGSIFYNLKSRNRQPEAVNSRLSSVQAYHEKFQALEFAGEKMRLGLKADQFSVDGSGRQHLEGNVEITDEEPAGGVRILAPRLVLDPEKKLARAGGEVSLVTQDLRLTAREFEYDLQNKVARAGQARLDRRNLSLSAGRLVYQAGNGRLELEEGISGEIKQKEEPLSFSSTRLIIESDGLSFQGTDLKLAFGPINLAAGKARFRLKETGAALDSVSLEGGARARCRFQEGESEFQEVNLSSEQMFLQAGRDGSVIRTPGAFEVESSGREWILTGRGEGLELYVENGHLARRLKAGRFRSSLKEAEGDEFWLAGQKADYDLASGLLQLGGRAEARNRLFILDSASLEFRLKDRNFLASGFNLEIRPEFFESPALFFKAGTAIYLSGEQLAGRPGFFDLNGQVRIWQTGEFCRAEKAVLEGRTGGVILEKLTESSWLVEREDGRRDRLELRAEQAGLQPEENRAVLSGRVELKLGNLRLASDELGLVFSAENPGRLSRLEARGRVNLSWKGYRAMGSRAEVDLVSETLTLAGTPKLITASGERLEADKLTLFLADDRIRLENRKRERSLTILVRGK
ncbi:MAG: hypothetical protein HPY46_09810 [Candidatus Aminicenantes bacterium]|nr:hypothetical protein [Candidatus Aminicenantes bacterium]